MTNILNQTRAYLVGQMQYCDGETWRVKVEGTLKSMGVIVFNPYNHPFVGSTQENSNIRDRVTKLLAKKQYDAVEQLVKQVRGEDLRVVDICDFVFCYIDPAYPTCGTWEEIFWANRMKKPIFFCVKGGKVHCPFWMFGVIPHKYIYDNIEDALQVLKKINSGKKKIDSDRWRLLREEYK